MLPAYVTPRKVPYFILDAAKAFSGLTAKEKRYAHHLNAAGWSGTIAVASQCSKESPDLLRFFHAFFTDNSPADLKAACKLEEDTFAQFLEYAAMVYSNMGNYLSFGDSKFIPACDRAVFEEIVSTAAVNGGSHAAALKAVIDKIYSVTEGELAMCAWPPKGTTSYYSENITEADATLVNNFLQEKKILPENTRVWKDGETELRVLVACANKRADPPVTYLGRTITVEYGDYAEQMARVVGELKLALPHAANDTQTQMLKHYIKHFEDGSIEDHKRSQMEWVKDKGPAVETNIGFIETYRDPSGVRAEWEGFVAVVNREQSKVYEDLVAKAPKFITYLPWGKDFEKDVFHKPDFTSLEILGFASSGVPLGICIPNYDDIRQDHGFKNVFLQNVCAAINFNDKMNHLTDADWEIYKTHFNVSMSLNVGLHELLGHGTGKLLQKKEDGSLNFAEGEVMNPLTGKPVATYYKAGETWSTAFGGISNAYEECRAEAVSLYLGLYDDILEVFGLTTDEDRTKTIHLEWLHMCRAGLVGIEFYTPETKQWRQAHMRARFCILQTLLRQENSIVNLAYDREKDFLEISLDAARIKTDGKKAIGELLNNLNINKSICDVDAGTKYFEDLTRVDDRFLQIRETVMKLRKPRKQFVQHHTRLAANSEHVELVTFEASAKGVIDSMVARHKDIPL